MRTLLFLLIGGGAFITISIIVVYNGLVSKRNMVRNAFSSIDVNLRKRHDLIPALVEAVKGFAAHEKETLTRLIEARNLLKGGTLSDSERLRVEGEIGPQMGRLMAVAEEYPELKSSDHFLNLQRNLTEVEEQISASRRAYNAAVFDMNNAVESFPTVIIARQFNFKRHDFFEADGSARGSLDVNL